MGHGGVPDDQVAVRVRVGHAVGQQALPIHRDRIGPGPLGELQVEFGIRAHLGAGDRLLLLSGEGGFDRRIDGDVAQNPERQRQYEMVGDGRRAVCEVAGVGAGRGSRDCLERAPEPNRPRRQLRHHASHQLVRSTRYRVKLICPANGRMLLRP